MRGFSRGGSPAPGRLQRREIGHATICGVAGRPGARPRHRRGAAEAKDSFKIAWSIYVGWMPWGWAADNGIVKKWADKYGIEIEVVQINDYVESINQYTAGGFDGCVMTNMDALTIPAVGGVDSTALIVGDFSNGNDGIVCKTAKSVTELKGRSINLVELSVSHYLLARALERNGIAEKDVKVVNTSDADIVSVFTGTETSSTWSPGTRCCPRSRHCPGATKLFDSSKIPGEIIDLMVVNSEALAANPPSARRWSAPGTRPWRSCRRATRPAIAARTAMAEASGTDLAGFDAQLASTRMFWDAEGGRRVRHQPEAGRDHGPSSAPSPTARAHGRRHGRGRHRLPGWQDAGRRGSIKLRFDRHLHEDGGRRRALATRMPP